MRSTSVSRAFLELLSAEHPKVVNSFTGASEALLEAGDYEVDSEGERRRMLDVYTLRYRDFEAGMIGMAACAALDNVTKQAMFSCETQLNRFSVLDLLCAKVLPFSKLPFGLGSFAFNVRVETDCMEFLKISSA